MTVTAPHRSDDGGTVILTYAPPRQDQEALLRVGRWVQRLEFDWDRFLLGWAACFHLAVAATLALAPWEQLSTEGTRPVLDIASRYLWAAVFLALGGLLFSLYRSRPRWVKALAWVSVLFLGGMWLTAFSLAALRNEGAALVIVAWFFLYGPIAVVAFRSLRKR